MIFTQQEMSIGREFGELRIQFIAGVPILHCNITTWSPTIYKKCKRIWSQVITNLVNQGCNKVYSVIANDADPMIHKWQRLFGLRPMLTQNGLTVYCMEIK